MRAGAADRGWNTARRGARRAGPAALLLALCLGVRTAPLAAQASDGVDPVAPGTGPNPALLAVLPEADPTTSSRTRRVDSAASPWAVPEEEVRERRDAWGMRRSPGLAAAEILAINFVAWSINHWGRNAEFTRVYPRTWWDNIRAGFEYDINLFQLNVFEHPFHGSLYYNASRSNGLGFWSAVPLTAAGSLLWECCAERHPMALNDVVYTTLGGVAMGESTYRLSSAILDNEATGAGRLGREVGAFLVNPIRGFNRFVSGRATSVHVNPADPDERTPRYFDLDLAAGYRAVGRSGSLSDAGEGAVLELRIDFGSPFEGRRGGPYDVFELDLSLVTGDRHPLEGLSIRGSLLTRDLRRGASADHVFVLIQEFGFANTTAYQFANQSLGARLESRWPLGDGADLRARIEAGWLIMGTLDSGFGLAGTGPDAAALRFHDYGTGLDGGLAAEARSGRLRASASWRVSWMGALNATASNGSGATHLIQQGRVAGRLPVGRSLSLGTELSVFLRDSDFELDAVRPVRLTVPELRLYGIWSAPGNR